MGTAYHKTITIALAAASTTAVCAAQSKVGAGALLINGAHASGGVATLDAARQILFTFAADETGHNFTITGTAFNGAVITEVVAGNDTTEVTTKEYLTVTAVSVSAATTGNVSVGTNGVASSAPYIVDRFVGAHNISATVVISGTVTYSVEVSYDDLAVQAWDVVTYPPTWFAPPNTTNLTSKSASAADYITMPIAMIRLHQDSFSTGGSATLTINVPMGSIGY